MDSKVIRRSSQKGLKNYLAALQDERQKLVIKQNVLHGELRSNKQLIQAVEARLKALSERELHVSDHAILRFIERVEAIPPGEVPSRILTDKLREMVATLGSGTFPLDGFSVRVEDNVVVTVFK